MIHVYVSGLPEGRSGTQEQSEQARRLLDRALQKEYPFVCAPVRVEKDELGKPYLPELPELFVSFTHSGPYVACAFGEKPVGVDLEMWKNRRNLKRVVDKFHPLEREAYEGAPEDKKEEIFYTLWVQKESFVKALGCGLRLPLDSFGMIPGEGEVRQRLREETYYYRSYLLEGESGCSLAVCSEDKEIPKAAVWLELSGEVSESQ